jgi:hypothetical protein
MAGSNPAPVCNLNPSVETPQGQVPLLPAIPPATDLPSAIAAINAVRQVILQQFGLEPPSSITINVNNGQGSGGQQQPPPSTGSFQEVRGSRQTTTVKVPIQFTDNGQPYLQLQVITGLDFQNKLGQTLKYSQGQGS